MNDYFQSKIISVNPKSHLSLQSHNHREEHRIVAHGFETVQLDQSVIEAKCESSIFISKGCKHRLTNTDEREYRLVIILEKMILFGMRMFTEGYSIE